MTEHGIAIDLDLKKIARGDHLETDKGHRISLMTSNYHTLNGARYKVLGTHKGRVYFKETKGKGIISAALANEDEPTKTEAKNESSTEESKNSAKDD